MAAKAGAGDPKAPPRKVAVKTDEPPEFEVSGGAAEWDPDANSGK